MPPSDVCEPGRSMNGNDMISAIEDIGGIRWMNRPAGIMDGEPVVSRWKLFHDETELRSFIEANKHQIQIFSCQKATGSWSGTDVTTGVDRWDGYVLSLRYAKKPGSQLVSYETMSSDQYIAYATNKWPAPTQSNQL